MFFSGIEYFRGEWYVLVQVTFWDGYGVLLLTYDEDFENTGAYPVESLGSQQDGYGFATRGEEMYILIDDAVDSGFTEYQVFNVPLSFMDGIFYNPRNPIANRFNGSGVVDGDSNARDISDDVSVNVQQG